MNLNWLEGISEPSKFCVTVAWTEIWWFWGRKTVQVASEFISPFTTVSEPSTRMTAWYGCTKHLRSSSCTAEMPTSFLRHNKHNVQSIFWNAFYPTSLILSWTLKSSEDALSKMKCSAFSQWYQILFFAVQCQWVYYSGHTLPGGAILSKPGFSKALHWATKFASLLSHEKKKTHTHTHWECHIPSNSDWSKTEGSLQWCIYHLLKYYN